MLDSSFIETPLGARRVDPLYSADHFSFHKVSEDSVLAKEIQELAWKRKFPAGQFYVLQTGPVIDEGIVNKALEKAHIDTKRFNLKDDLPGGAFLSKDDPNLLPFWLAHSIEHLAVARIFEDGHCIHPRPRLGNKSWGETVVYEARTEQGEARALLGFHFRWGIASPRMIDQSILRVQRDLLT
jgi:hypothetical protein